MEIRLSITPEDGVYVHQDDIVDILRSWADELLGHISGHAESGEFHEALEDQHIAVGYQRAADFFAAQQAPPPPS